MTTSEPSAVVQRPNHLGEAWCSQHQCHPNKCFEIHRPDAKRVAGALTEAEHHMRIAAAHTLLQQQNANAAAQKAALEAQSEK